jgi:hypothetical protein
VKELSQKRYEALAGYTRQPFLVLIVEEVNAYATEDERVLGVVTHDLRDDDFGWVALGRDETLRYRCIEADASLPSFQSARDSLWASMEKFASEPDEEFHQGDTVRAPVDFFAPVAPPDRRHRIFDLLVSGRRHSCAREIIAAMMRYHVDVDGHFVREFQSDGFDARLWELYVFAAFSELRYAADATHHVPDFIWTSPFGKFGVEATTINAPPGKIVQLPQEAGERIRYFENYVPIKFARTMRKKLQRTPSYWGLPHMQGLPFVLAVQDFHAPRSMQHISFVLTEYLFGIRHRVENGTRIIERLAEHRYGDIVEPSGFFALPGAENVSAVIANPQGTISKFNRMGFVAGFGDQSLRITRSGLRRSELDGATGPMPFNQDVHDPAYTEEWVEGMVVWHNPTARVPLNPELIPGAAHEFLQEDGRIMTILPPFHPIFSQTAIEIPVDFECLAPDQVTEPNAALFRELVLAAGEVDPTTLPALYGNALVLGFARSHGKLVGVGAIKRPFPGHRDQVFAMARATFSPTSFVYELGWFHVLKDFEGNRISSRMVEQLMSWANGASVYATSRINNDRMHGALTRRGGFVVEGSDFPSQRGAVPLRLFVRQH